MPLPANVLFAELRQGRPRTPIRSRKRSYVLLATGLITLKGKRTLVECLHIIDDKCSLASKISAECDKTTQSHPAQAAWRDYFRNQGLL